MVNTQLSPIRLSQQGTTVFARPWLGTGKGSPAPTPAPPQPAEPQKPKGNAAKVAADVAMGAGMIGLTALTISQSGASGALPKTGAPAIAFANLGLGLVYLIDQSIDLSKANYDSAKETTAWLGIGAGASLAVSGLTAAAGASPGWTIAFSTIAAALLAGKGLAHLKLQNR
ncbi:MAG: hypothetical protein HYU64_12635 [Armatimonadetes bacterium]|nr:hypothetical protein [Armatimonadota bacterium]